MKAKTKFKPKFAILATDGVVFSLYKDKLRVLLVKAVVPEFKNKWATPGGLVGPNEKLKQSVKRQVGEFLPKVVNNTYFEQVRTFGDPGRDPSGRVVSVSYMGLAPVGLVEPKRTKKYPEVDWFDVRKLPKLAYDGEQMIQMALDHLGSKLEYADLVRYLMPKEFTLTELQKAYEIVWGRELDKRNFRKKIEGLGIIKAFGKKRKGEAYRPAELYGFKSKK